MKKLKKSLAFFAATALTVTTLSFGTLQTSAANDLFVVQDFEKYTAGTKITADESELGHLAEPLAESVTVVEMKKALTKDWDGQPITGNYGGDNKALQFVNGGTASPDFQQVVLNVPKDKQDWSAYKNGYLNYYLDLRAATVNCAHQIFLIDGDGETWGFKTNFLKPGWVWPTIDGKGNYKIRQEGTAWGGIGFGNWMQYYSGIQLSESVFMKYEEPSETTKGNGTFDLKGVQKIIFRVDNASGNNKGETFYVDNFFLSKGAMTAKEKSLLADGVDIFDYFVKAAASKADKPSSTPTESKPTSVTTTSSTAATASSKGDEATTASKPDAASSSLTDVSTTETSSVAEETPVSSSAEEATASESEKNDPDKGGFPIWAIVLIVVVVVAALGVGGFFLYRFLSNKKKDETADK